MEFVATVETPGVSWLQDFGFAMGGLALLVWWIAPRVSGLLEYQRDRVRDADESLRARLARTEAENERLQARELELVAQLVDCRARQERLQYDLEGRKGSLS